MKTADLITPTKQLGNFRSLSGEKEKPQHTSTTNLQSMSQSMSHVFVVPGGADVGTGVSVGLANRLRGHEDHVTALSWSSDGQHVVSGSKECRVLVWDVPPSNTLQIPEPPNQATSASAAASAAAVAAGLGVMKPLEELNMGSGANWTLAACFSPSNRFVAVAGLNQKIR
jgi:WD40 repeat protein